MITLKRKTVISASIALGLLTFPIRSHALLGSDAEVISVTRLSLPNDCYYKVKMHAEGKGKKQRIVQVEELTCPLKKTRCFSFGNPKCEPLQ